MTAAIVKVYKSENNHWSYLDLKGAVVFLKDKSLNDSFFFRLVDLGVSESCLEL